MNKRLVKEVVWVALPCLVLMGVALLTRQSGEPLISVESVTVSSVPAPLGVWRGKPLYRPDDPDTKVRVVLNHQPPSLSQKLFGRLHWQELDPGYLVGEKGTQFHVQLPAKSSPTVMVSTYGQDEQYLGHGRYAVDLLFPLRQVPRAAGQVRLKANSKSKESCSPSTSPCVISEANKAELGCSTTTNTRKSTIMQTAAISARDMGSMLLVGPIQLIPQLPLLTASLALRVLDTGGCYQVSFSWNNSINRLTKATGATNQARTVVSCMMV